MGNRFSADDIQVADCIICCANETKNRAKQSLNCTFCKAPRGFSCLQQQIRVSVLYFQEMLEICNRKLFKKC